MLVPFVDPRCYTATTIMMTVTTVINIPRISLPNWLMILIPFIAGVVFLYIFLKHSDFFVIWHVVYNLLFMPVLGLGVHLE